MIEQQSSTVNAGYTEAGGHAASLRQQANWIEEARDGTGPAHLRIDLGDIDVDELRAAADFIERQARIPAQEMPDRDAASLSSWSKIDTELSAYIQVVRTELIEACAKEAERCDTHALFCMADPRAIRSNIADRIRGLGTTALPSTPSGTEPSAPAASEPSHGR